MKLKAPWHIKTARVRETLIGRAESYVKSS